MTARSLRPSARWLALLVTVIAAAYLGLAGWRGVLLVRDGSLVAVVLGLAVLTIPLIGGWVLWSELRFGMATKKLARELEAEGGLPSDDLPRRPSGRPDRAAAAATVARRKADADAAPDDWRVWYRLAIAYDDAGDRRRARQAMRRAVALWNASRVGE